MNLKSDNNDIWRQVNVYAWFTCAALLFIAFLATLVMSDNYSTLPNGDTVDSFGRTTSSTTMLVIAHLFGERYYRGGLTWFIIERVVYWGSVILLFWWGNKLRSKDEPGGG